MKAVIITCFESNEERAAFVYDVCLQKNYEVQVYTSDFSHIRKEKRKDVPEGFTALPARKYRKNLSLARILSHIRFAKDVFALMRRKKPDLIWLMAPANSLIKEAAAYRRDVPETKLIIDIIDMWPESLPLSIDKDRFPFSVWKRLRSDYLKCCDLLVCECDLYREILEKEYPGKIETIRWARKPVARISKKQIGNDVLSLVYIGSINNIIDTGRIQRVIAGIDMPVTLHVIGDGENRERFLEKMKEVCDVRYHGVVMDEEKKAQIFEQCHAGINIYKEDLYIGLTVKCIDYFEHGLPIINNIRGDTKELIETYHAGINLDGSDRFDARRIINMRENNWSVYSLFEENFSRDVFVTKCREAIGEVLE